MPQQRPKQLDSPLLPKIFKYAGKCPGAQDYAALAREVEAMPAAAKLPRLESPTIATLPPTASQAVFNSEEIRRAA